MTIDINLDELEATAKAASQGLWEAEQSDETIELNKGTALTKWGADGTVGFPARSWRSTDRLIEIDIEDFGDDEVEDIAANVDHIAAARPEVVLALIERVRAAEALVSADDLSTPPADDVRAEAELRWPVMTTHYSDGDGTAYQAEDYGNRKLREAFIAGAEVRPRGTVPDAEVVVLPNDCDCEDREALVRPEGLVCGTCGKVIS